MRKQYLIVYDIVDAKRLQRVAKILCNVGVRVQKSVFEVYVDDASLQRLMSKLASVTEDEDGIKIFQLCESCTGRHTNIGNAEFAPPLAEWIVL